MSESHPASQFRQELFKQTLDDGRIVLKLNLKLKASAGTQSKTGPHAWLPALYDMRLNAVLAVALFVKC